MDFLHFNVLGFNNPYFTKISDCVQNQHFIVSKIIIYMLHSNIRATEQP